MSYMTIDLHKVQDALLTQVFRNLDQFRIPNTLLAGGTALARYYLQHRVSYDLDFFVPARFSPDWLAVLLGKAGITLNDVQMEQDGSYAHQLHGYANGPSGEPVKVSFVEDVYEGMWPTVKFGEVVTEEIGGLYHRKLRTVTGSGYGKETKGARQTARDLFDLYVLSKEIKPINEFVEEINEHGANFPQDAFCANLLSMPWMDLMEEFDRLERLAPYEEITLMRDVKGELAGEALRLQDLMGDENDRPTP